MDTTLLGVSSNLLTHIFLKYKFHGVKTDRSPNVDNSLQFALFINHLNNNGHGVNTLQRINYASYNNLPNQFKYRCQLRSILY